MSVLKGKTTVEQHQGEYLHLVFEQVAKDFPSKIAVIDPEKKLTFHELNELSNRLSRWIKDNHGSHSLIAVRFEPNVDLIAILLAIIKSGNSYVPIAPDWPKSRFSYIVNDAQPVICITNIQEADTSSFYEVIKMVQFEDIKRECGSLDASNLSLHCNTQFAVMYTSGSTGLPKGVKLLHKSALFRAQWQWELLPYKSEDDVCAFKAALTFIDAVTEIFSALLSGHTLAVAPREVVKNSAKFVDFVEKFNISRLFLIPSLMGNMIDVMGSPDRLPKLKQFESTGEALTLSVAKKFFDFFGTTRVLANVHGGTEMMDNIYDVYWSYEEFLQKSLNETQPSLGIPVNNATIYIMDASMRPMAEGGVGEICISSPGLADGYIGQHANIEAFVTMEDHQKVYRTGDFGKVVNGRMYYEGRKDSQVKIRGQRLNLSEIEATIKGIQGVKEACVQAVKPHEPMQQLVAFVLVQEEVLESHLKAALETKLPLFMVPKIRILDDFPKLVNGKVDRQALVKDFCSRPIDVDCSDSKLLKDGVPVAFLDDAKILLQTVAKVVFAQGDLSILDNFFEIGGNSINAVYTVSLLNEQGLKVNIGLFVEAENLLQCLMIDEKQPSVLKLNFRDLREDDKDVALDMIAKTYHEQETVCVAVAVEHNVTLEDCYYEWAMFWPHFMQHGLSFVGLDADTNEVVAVMFGFDHFRHFDTPKQSNPIIDEALEFVISTEEHYVGEIFGHDCPPGKVYDPMYLATKRSLSPQQQLQLVDAMEQHALDQLRERGMIGILGMNTSPVTQHVALSKGYTRAATVQINTFISKNGNRTFAKVSDDVVVTVDFLKL